jgi:hypothetical protein
MTNESLRTYIENQRITGASDSAITSALLENGWNISDINSALSTMHMPLQHMAPTKPVRIISILLGILSVSQFGTSFAIAFTIYTINAALSKNGQSPPYEFIRYFNALPIKIVSSAISGSVYAYLSMRILHMDKRAIGLTITAVIVIMIVELITGTFTSIQMNTILQTIKTSGA